MSRTLPGWDPSWSDGCSVFAVLPVWIRKPLQRKLIRLLAGDPEVARAAIAACGRHDEEYYYGGASGHRKSADERLRAGWRQAGLPRWFVALGIRTIRLFGGPGGRRKGVSWAFGGGHFRYDDEPARASGG